MYHGIININKEKGMTSFDVVAILRGICGQKKIGHTGTLDPDAEGVLPVCLGKATKVCGLLTDRDKEYIATLRLGLETDTQDITGTVIRECDTDHIAWPEVEQVILDHVGKLEQIPPMYSARKINGKRLYEYAREGISIERKAHPIEIYDIKILSSELPDVKMRVHCSKGTYIRTLCHDIGRQLGCGGVMTDLLRTKSAGFTLEESYHLDELRALAKNGRLDSAICPVECVFSNLGRNCVRPEYDKLLCNGSKLPSDAFPPDSVPDSDREFRACTSQGDFAGIYHYSEEEDIYRVVKNFYIN